MSKKHISKLDIWLVVASGMALAAIGLVARLLTRGPLSLRRIDGHPLYVMHYAGDYGFAEYLRTINPEEAAAQAEDDGFMGGGEGTESVKVAGDGVEGGGGCTVFAGLNPQGDRLLGRNFDWYADHPALLLFTNPKAGYASVSMVDLWYLGYTGKEIGLSERKELARAPYLPFDGMNEMGVAVGIMALNSSDGMRDPALPTLEGLEAIRLVLDYAASVEEAIELLEGYNVRFDGGVPLHYLVADAKGNSAVIEYVGGEMRVMRNTQPWQVATNFILSIEKPVGADSSCSRYNTAYQVLQENSGLLGGAQALELLERTSQFGDFPTIWSMVYNLTSGEISLVMDRNYEQVYTFQLKRTNNP